MSLPELRVIGLPGIPIVTPGADLVALIHQAAVAAPFSLQAGDIVVITQKIVSKAEGCLIALKDVTPSPWAEQYARQWGKDPRHVEVVLRQSRRIVRMDRGVLISETHHGFICANAGVDQSNIEGEEVVAVLPIDPDASARAIRQGLHELLGVEVAVIISDTFGRPWRDGIVNIAIGLSGMQALKNYIGQLDAAKVYPRKIVTEVVPFKAFFRAEEYHQDYLQTHTDQPYIVYNDLPKLEHLKKEFAELYH